MDKINTQGMSDKGDWLSFSTTNTSTQHQPMIPLNDYTCFTEMEREELMEMMRCVVNESLLQCVKRGCVEGCDAL